MANPRGMIPRHRVEEASSTSDYVGEDAVHPEAACRVLALATMAGGVPWGSPGP